MALAGAAHARWPTPSPRSRRKRPRPTRTRGRRRGARPSSGTRSRRARRTSRGPNSRRFRGLCTNLRERDNVGRLTRETNGQTIDEQYRFPGVSEGRHANGANLAGTPRMEWFDEGGLREAAAAACGELDAALSTEAPLAADHKRGLRRGEESRRVGLEPHVLEGVAVPTAAVGIKCLDGDDGGAAPARRAGGAPLLRHLAPGRGLPRQAPLDHHNFVLSTLTPLRGCTKATGIVLDGVETPLLDGEGGNPGATVLVDNTFDHQVYNDLTEDSGRPLRVDRRDVAPGADIV